MMKIEIYKYRLIIPLLIGFLFVCVFFTNAQDSKPKPKVVPKRVFTPKPPTTSKYGTVTDIDGNVYKTVTIGNQIWMAENLKTSKYNDGTPIPYQKDNEKWKNLRMGAYFYNDNSNKNIAIYGKLYNWYAVKTERLAPKGWHIPSKKEWEQLINYLGGENMAGEKMKSTSSSWRCESDIVNTNSSGFSGLPGGCRNYTVASDPIGSSSYWWSSTDDSTRFDFAYACTLGCYNDDTSTSLSQFMTFGFSVRCIKD